MPDNKQAEFRFWWPTSEASSTALLSTILALGVTSGAGSWSVEDAWTVEGILLVLAYAGSSMVGGFFVINLGRTALHAWSHRAPTPQERAELESLRGKMEMRRLGGQLAESEAESKGEEQQEGGA